MYNGSTRIYLGVNVPRKVYMLLSIGDSDTHYGQWWRW